MSNMVTAALCSAVWFRAAGAPVGTVAGAPVGTAAGISPGISRPLRNLQPDSSGVLQMGSGLAVESTGQRRRGGVVCM